MGRVFRIRTDDYELATGKTTLELPPRDSEVDLKISIQTITPVAVFLKTVQGLFPLALWSCVDRTYNVGPEVEALVFVPQDKSGQFGFCVQINGTRHKDVVDPIPDVVPVPLDNNSLQLRVMRAVNAALDARGLSSPGGKGVRYDDVDDDALEGEFGPGYQYDEQSDAEIEAAAREAVAKKYWPGATDAHPGRVRKSSRPSRDDVSDDNSDDVPPDSDEPGGANRAPPASSAARTAR